MISIKEAITNTLIDLMVRCMLNPENEDFYIGTMSENKLNKLIVENKGMETIYRTAYQQAKEKQSKLECSLEM